MGPLTWKQGVAAGAAVIAGSSAAFGAAAAVENDEPGKWSGAAAKRLGLGAVGVAGTAAMMLMPFTTHTEHEKDIAHRAGAALTSAEKFNGRLAFRRGMWAGAAAAAGVVGAGLIGAAIYRGVTGA
jgi:hypothetical protein